MIKISSMFMFRKVSLYISKYLLPKILKVNESRKIFVQDNDFYIVLYSFMNKVTKITFTCCKSFFMC